MVDPDDPVIGGPQCLVLFGKCSAHPQRWIDGRPDVEAWAQAVPANGVGCSSLRNAQPTPVVAAVGWDVEFPRDVWLLRRLGFPGRDTQFRITGTEPIWMRHLTKRWARWRLPTGIAVATVGADIRAITLFAQSFPALQRGPEALTRELVEVHLAHLVERFPNPKSRTGQLSSLARLLRTAPSISAWPR